MCIRHLTDLFRIETKLSVSLWKCLKKLYSPSKLFLFTDLSHDESQIKMKLKVVWRKVCDYIRYDLKEIAFPSSLPDPPHIKKRRKLTWQERYYVSSHSSSFQ